MSDIRPAQAPESFLYTKNPSGSNRPPVVVAADVRPVPRRTEPTRIVTLGSVRASDEVPYFRESTYVPSRPVRPVESPRFQAPPSFENAFEIPRTSVRKQPVKEVVNEPRSASKSHSSGEWKRRFGAAYFSLVSASGRLARSRVFILIAILTVLLFGSAFLVFRGIVMKNEVLNESKRGYESINAAVDGIKDRNFEQSGRDFEDAAQSFTKASEAFDAWSAALTDLSRFFPGASKLSSGKNAMEAGKHIAIAGQNVNEALRVLSGVKNPLDPNAGVSLLEVFRKTESNISFAKDELILAQDSLDRVKTDDLPEDKRDRFIQVKTQLPSMIAVMEGFSASSHVLTDLLGGNGPRKYLFLFQNNHEMRPTGGFIGSYGLLDLADGRVRKFFVDGIFNPDGQLRQDIVPPKPIQKVSAAWSLHDSNWFPDFPTSAEKAISFYEKTGGPTVDGVITLTPTVMQKLLRVTGPIRMDAYGKTLDANNFIEEVQQEVEVDYDKKKNQPKQILADLAPMLLDRLFNVKDAAQAVATVQAFEEGLGEKHILLYSRNQDVEKMIDDAGWSGRMFSAEKDYLSVVNTNINGYKTDGVIDESIDHKASIQDDGSVIDTVTVTRKHNGGHTDKDWWNRVNADYLRVYVPLGSKLLSAQGQTREVVTSPLDYDKLGFRRDADVEKVESSIGIDPESGTQVFEESGKTVFANWAYVSPQETVTVTYTYLLPFKVKPDLSEKGGFDTYSLAAEKQAGSFGSRLTASVDFPSNLKTVWQSSENLLPYDGGLRFDGDLKRDRFIGVVFGK